MQLRETLCGRRVLGCAPGGGIEFGEFSVEAGIREVKEETGIEAEITHLLWTVEEKLPDGSMNYANYFLGRVVGRTLKVGSDPELSEHEQVLLDAAFFTREQVHIVDVEQAWILQGLQGKPEFHYRYEDYRSIQAIPGLSDKCHPLIKQYVDNWSEDLENRKLDDFTYGEVMRHVIAHEIHHIGQLSVWAREMGRHPVNVNLIGRGLVH